MKLCKFLILSMVSAIVAVSFSLSVSAQSQTHNTNVDIGFVEGSTDPTPPVNPENPSVVEPENPGTGMPGPLSLDWAPVLRFGSSHAVSSIQQAYNTITNQPYLQVTDLRGTGAGWKVTAALSGFTSGGNPSLPGAYITLKNGRPNSNTSGIAAPTPANPVTLTSDSETVSVATAHADTQAGRGTWVVRWYPASSDGDADVQLIVPAATAVRGTHNAEITWILYDTP